MEQLTSYSLKDYTLRTEHQDGKKYLVAPVVMMVEGVHNGSRGPLFHPISELGKDPQTWEGMPVTVHHPQEGGKFVSANDNHAVGKVSAPKVEDRKLKAEAWLDEQKLIAASPQAYQHIIEGRPIEVSIGVFTEEVEMAGVWNDEQYSAIARNHRPDHLALLPGDVGACSWQDGCGIRVNVEKSREEVMNQKNEKVMSDNKSPCFMKKVEKLIANEQTQFTTDDRDWLMEQDEAVLNKLEPIEVQPNVNKEQAIEALKESLSTAEDYLNLMPQEMKSQMQSGLKLYNDHREQLIANIKKNTDAWEDGELEAQDTAMLEKISKTTKKADYSAMSANNSKPEVEPLFPAGINVK